MEGSVTALPIIAVKIKVRGGPLCTETYALLDNGSNSVCSASLLECLGINGKKMKPKLTTMHSSKDVDSLIVTALVVTDRDKNVVITLLEVLSRQALPIAKDKITRQEDVERWLHLQGHVNLPELNSEVDLLIGANAPEALQSSEGIPAFDGGPYVTRGDLGWIINGTTGRKQKYHHTKPDKISVVFNCSAQFQGTLLSNELFQGPDLTNNLVSVLICFCQEPVAVMGDVQSMFHQVCAPEAERDLLQFLWWPQGYFSEKLEEYRMTVHLFGVVSSPSCPNYAMHTHT